MGAAGSTAKLRRLGDADLVIGSPVRGDVCDLRGRVIIKAGQMLDESTLESARSASKAGLFGGADWSAGASPPPAEAPAAGRGSVESQRILKQLSDQHAGAGGGGKGFKDRKHERRAWAVPLTVMLEERTGQFHRSREVEVTTHNISVGGFAFVYNQYVHAGTIVKVQFDTLPNKPKLTGVVRNCAFLSGRQHRVGVQFLDSEK